MRDVESCDDCYDLVVRFYAAVREDELLGPLFASRIDCWDEHLVTMSRFWATVLLALPLYHGDPGRAHLGLPIEAEHHARWLELWRASVNALFVGERAARAVARAEKISVVLARRLGRVA